MTSYCDVKARVIINTPTDNHNNPTQLPPQPPKITTWNIPPLLPTPPSTLTFSEVPSLDHEVLDHAMEGTAFEGQGMAGGCCFRRVAWRGGGGEREIKGLMGYSVTVG